MAEKADSLCPSAQPDWVDAQLIGVIGGASDKPVMAHIASPQPVTEELLALSSPVTPTEVFRFAAPCICEHCAHFSGETCRLAAKVVEFLPEVAERAPSCAIRPQCRWWLQEGNAACLRCAQVVTDNYNPSQEMRIAATVDYDAT